MNKSSEYLTFLKRRGFNPQEGPGKFLKHMFLDPWIEPGIHRFWRTWNPLYGFYLLKLYKALGGNKRSSINTVLVFLFCGFFLHDIFNIIPKQKLTLTMTFAFLFFAFFTILNKKYDQVINFSRFHSIINLALNVLQIALGLFFGVNLNKFLINSF